MGTVLGLLMAKLLLPLDSKILPLIEIIFQIVKINQPDKANMPAFKCSSLVSSTVAFYCCRRQPLLGFLSL